MLSPKFVRALSCYAEACEQRTGEHNEQRAGKSNKLAISHFLKRNSRENPEPHMQTYIFNILLSLSDRHTFHPFDQCILSLSYNFLSQVKNTSTECTDCVHPSSVDSRIPSLSMGPSCHTLCLRRLTWHKLRCPIHRDDLNLIGAVRTEALRKDIQLHRAGKSSWCVPVQHPFRVRLRP